MPTFEYRKLYRANIILRVEYRTLKQPIVAGVAYSKNLSSTGINVVLDNKLEQDTSVELKIFIRKDENPVVANAVILWQTECSFVPESGNNYYSTGIRFAEMSPEDAIIESDFVKDILVSQSEEQNKEIIDRIEEIKKKD